MLAVAERRLVYCLVSTHRVWRRFQRDETGATAIEYGLIIGGISIDILATAFALGAELNDVFEYILSALDPLARCVEVGSNCTK